MKNNLKIKMLFVLMLSIILIFLFKGESKANVTINSTDIKIYAINQEDKEKYNIPDIPSNYPQSFQLKVSGNTGKPEFYNDPSLYTKHLDITDDGLITPKTHITTYTGTDGTVIKTVYEYEFGTHKVYAKVDGKEYEINVEIIDYKTIYADSIVKQYLDQNIKEGMTEREKLEVVTKYVAGLEYSVQYQSYEDMVLSKSGDCWASCNTIIRMCDMIGIRAENRSPFNDGGIVGSGHRNVIAYADGKYYIVDAGYSEPAPRYYKIVEEPDGLCFGTNSDGTLTLKQYDAFDTDVVIPSEYNGRKVTAIGRQCFQIQNWLSNVKITSVTLPNTITKIEEEAFSNCEELKKVNIPESVSSIGGALFTGSYNVQVSMSSNNSNYCIKGNILYNKSGTELIECMVNEGTVNVPNGVTSIKEYAFSQCLMEKVVVPNSVTSIGDYAFYKCENLKEVTLPNNFTKLPQFLFSQSNIEKFTIGDKVQEIGAYLLAYCHSLQNVVISKNVTTTGNNIFNYSSVKTITIEDGSKLKLTKNSFYSANLLEMIRIPESITEIEDNLFSNPEKVTIITKSGSAAEKYAKANNINYILEDSKTSIKVVYIYNPENEFDYNGKPIKPNTEIYYGGDKLTEGVDYITTYPNDITNAGEKEVTITGIGKFEGTTTYTYKIKQIKDDFTFTCPDVVYGNQFKIEITSHASGSTILHYFKDENGHMYSNPKNAGKYELSIWSYGTNNYIGVTKYKEVNILKADNNIKVQCNNVTIGGTPKPTVSNNVAGANVTYYYKLKNASDSIYTKTVPTKVGDYVVKAVAEETKNYKEGTATANFSITNYLKGDMDKNGEVTAYDAYLVNLIYEEGRTPTDEELQIGDIDGDGELTAYDAFKINVAYENGTNIE